MAFTNVKWNAAAGGNYDVATDWTPNGVPVSASDYVDLPTLASAYSVDVTKSYTVGFLEVDGGATFSISDDSVYSIASSVTPYSNVYNFGVISVAAGSSFALGLPTKNDSAELNGPGTTAVSGALYFHANYDYVLGGQAIALIGGSILGETTSASNLTVKNATVQGYGTIGNGSLEPVGGSLILTVAKEGTINADGGAGQALTLNTGVNQIQDAGVIETTGAGGLKIDSTMFDNGALVAAGSGALTIANEALVESGGSLTVDNGGAVVLDGGMISLGGVISIAAGGKLVTNSGTTLGVGASGSFVGDVLTGGDIEDNGAITIANDSTLNYNASAYGAGSVSLAGSTGPTKLEIFGDGGSFYETGGVILSNSEENSIVGDGEGVQVSDHTKISGAGVIGDGWLRLFVAPTGVINANDADALTINADSKAVSAGSELANFSAGTVETTGAGGLTINGAFGNAGYIIAAGAGALTLDGAQINTGGGIVETTGSGVIKLENNAEIYNQGDLSVSSKGVVETTANDSLDVLETSVFNLGAIDIANGSTLEVNSHWQNSGAINLNGSTAATKLEIEAGNTLELLGAGTLVMNGAKNMILSGGAGAEFENKSNTIKGSGEIGDANMVVNNAGGTIDATGAAGFTIDLQAYSDGNTYINNQGLIEASTGSSVTFEQAMFNGGSLTALTGGSIVADAAVYGPGVANLQGNGSIEFKAENDSDVHFASGADATLKVDDPAAFYGTIYGFGEGDSIDLTHVTYSSNLTVNASNFGSLDGNLVLMNGTTTESAPLWMEGNYSAAYLSAHDLRWSVTELVPSLPNDGVKVSLVSTTATLT